MSIIGVVVILVLIKLCFPKDYSKKYEENLIRTKELFDKGLITEEEFNKRKNSILNKMNIN